MRKTDHRDGRWWSLLFSGTDSWDENQQRTRITCFPGTDSWDENQQRNRILIWIRKDKVARQIHLVLLYWDWFFISRSSAESEPTCDIRISTWNWLCSNPSGHAIHRTGRNAHATQSWAHTNPIPPPQLHYKIVSICLCTCIPLYDIVCTMYS